MKKIACLLAVAVSLSWATIASATTLDFEDITGDPSGITNINTVYPSGYAGFTWSASARAVDPGIYAGTPTHPGFAVGTVGTYSAFGSGANPLSLTRGTAFDFTGALLTCSGTGVNPTFSENLTITGLLGGSTVATQTITIHADSVTNFNATLFAGFNNVDSIVFTPLGVPDGGQVVVDNFNYNEVPSTVPEPSSLILLGGGLVGAYFIRRKRNQKN